MNTQKIETYLINEPTKEVENMVGNKATFIVATIQPKENEFKIEPYEVYQQYNGDFKKAQRILAKKLANTGFIFSFHR